MGLRPARCYRDKKDRAYTRTAKAVHRRNYVGTTPAMRVRQFNMGNARKDYKFILDLVILGDVQIRDNALESARITINRYLNNRLGKDNYFMRIRIFPHQILRENKQAQGAGADRVSQGMSHSFGKAVGRAARVRKGQRIVSVLVNESDVATAREALKRAKARFPCSIKVVVHKDVKSIGTRPKRIIEVEKEEPEEKEEEKEEEGEEKEEEEKEGKEKLGEKEPEEKKKGEKK